MITALQALRITGEVITTPYSLWQQHIRCGGMGLSRICGYRAGDVQYRSGEIEAAITPKTTAIMPVHVYGKPCDTVRIQEIADKYGLKMIYDAAHAFGVEVNGKSVLEAGDMSTLSFHATKVYNTVEGGSIGVS